MSHALLDQLKAAISPELLSDASKSLNEPQAAIEQAISAALPALISAIAGATRMPSGLSGVMRMMHDPINDGTLTTQLASLYKGTMVAAPIYRLGSQLLQLVLGSRQSLLAQAVAALSGVRPASAGALLHILAPHVLDVLGRDHRAVADTSAEGFARYMEKQKAQVGPLLPEPLAELLKGAAAVTAVKAVTVHSGGKSGAAGSALLAPAKPAVPARVAVQAGQTTPAVPAARSVALAKPSTPVATVKPNVTGLRDADSRWGAIYLASMLALAAGGVFYGLYSQLDPNGTARVASKPAQVPAPAAGAPAKTAEAPKPAKAQEAAPLPRAATGAQQVPKTTVAAVDAKSAPVRGTTTYYGTDKPPAEKPATANPDYKPLTAAPKVAEIAAVRAVPVPGDTTYYGTEKPLAEKPAVANPDYKPLPPVVAQVAPVEVGNMAVSQTAAADSGPKLVVSPDSRAAPVAQSTSATGVAKPVDELPAVASMANGPAATIEAVPAPSTATVATPVAKLPPAEPKAKPGAKLAAAIADAADGKAGMPASVASDQVFANASGGVTTYYGPGPKASMQTCSDAVASAAKSGTVLFRSGSADLTAGSLPVLKRVAKAFHDCRGAKLSISGFTDDTGPADMNKRLSDMRAKSVRGYLTLRGVDAGRLTSEGFGASRPVAPNTSPENKAKNRRIEFAVETL